MPWEDLENESLTNQQQPPLVSLEKGFVSLAVGESMTIQTAFWPDHELIKAGERYKIFFRGVGIKWWRFGSVEELEARGVRVDDGETDEGRPSGSITVPCSNLVEFLVGGED